MNIQTQALVGLLCLLAVGCASFLKLSSYPDPVDLNWSAGDIVFASMRATPTQTEGWDGPLYLLDSDTNQWAPIENSQPQLTLGIAPTWSSTGDTLAFIEVVSKFDAPNNEDVRGYDGTIFLDAQGHRRLFGSRQYAVTWSPDGQLVAFYAVEAGQVSLKTSRPDGSGERTIVSDVPAVLERKITLRDVRLSWSPDGETIAYDRLNEAGRRQIWVVSVHDGSAHALVSGSHPAWSPLGDEIAFDRAGDIWIICLAQDQAELVVRARQSPWLYDGWPSWSPDGRQLAFVASWEGPADIYRINRDGSGLENLTNHPSFDAFPAWRP